MTWLANVLIIVGLYLMGNKNPWAFAFTICGELLWAVMSAIRGQFDMTFICVVFTGLAIRNLYKWSRHERTT